MYRLAPSSRNQQGHVTSQLTLEQKTTEISFNGSPPQKENSLSLGIRTTYIVVFDADGNVIALTAPEMTDSNLVYVQTADHRSVSTISR